MSGQFSEVAGADSAIKIAPDMARASSPTGDLSLVGQTERPQPSPEFLAKLEAEARRGQIVTANLDTLRVLQTMDNLAASKAEIFQTSEVKDLVEGLKARGYTQIPREISGLPEDVARMSDRLHGLTYSWTNELARYHQTGEVNFQLRNMVTDLHTFGTGVNADSWNALVTEAWDTKHPLAKLTADPLPISFGDLLHIQAERDPAFRSTHSLHDIYQQAFIDGLDGKSGMRSLVERYKLPINTSMELSPALAAFVAPTESAITASTRDSGVVGKTNYRGTGGWAVAGAGAILLLPTLSLIKDKISSPGT